MISRVYIAAPYQMIDEASVLAELLTNAGITVTSRWLGMQKGTDHEMADMDLKDVSSAHAVVLINPERWSNRGTGGRHVEVGAAIAWAMPVFILGVRSNIFHSLNSCHVVETVEELVTELHAAAPVAYAIQQPPFAVAALQQLIGAAHTANRRWWLDLDTGALKTRNVGELLMLTVSELAEAMEGHRKHLNDDKLPHFPMITVELADALIRIFDIAGGLSLDLPQAFEEKMQYNAQREDHTEAHRRSEHGKKY